MVGYILGNTVTDNGHVSRGVCTTNDQHELVEVTERTKIEKRNGGIAFTEDDGETWTELPADTIVSMNMWGFIPNIPGQGHQRESDEVRVFPSGGSQQTVRGRPRNRICTQVS